MASPWPPAPLFGPKKSTAPCEANAAAPGLIGLQAQWASTVGQDAVLTTDDDGRMRRAGGAAKRWIWGAGESSKDGVGS